MRKTEKKEAGKRRTERKTEREMIRGKAKEDMKGLRWPQEQQQRKAEEQVRRGIGPRDG